MTQIIISENSFQKTVKINSPSPVVMEAIKRAAKEKEARKEQLKLQNFSFINI